MTSYGTSAHSAGLGLVSLCVCLCFVFRVGLFVIGLVILSFCVLCGCCLVVSTSAIDCRNNLLCFRWDDKLYTLTHSCRLVCINLRHQPTSTY